MKKFSEKNEIGPQMSGEAADLEFPKALGRSGSAPSKIEVASPATTQ